MERLSHPETINGRLMFVISTCGLCVNLLMGFILAHSGHSHSHGLRTCDHGLNDEDMKTPLSPSAAAYSFDVSNFTLSMNNSKCADPACSSDCTHSSQLERTSSSGDQSVCSHEQCGGDMDNMNIRAAYIHVIADTMQSFGVVLSSALIWYDSDRFAIVDPICTLLFAALGFACSLNILNDITSIFMLRTPKCIDIEALQRNIEDLDARILGVEDLRVWGLTANERILTCRIQTRSDALNKPGFFARVRELALQNGISDATIQVENIATKTKRQKHNFSLIGRAFV